jgi:O-antigen/teichoic acid export membrane protein
MTVFRLLRINEFFSGEERSVKVKKNIAALVLLKGFNAIITFFLVPLTLHYLNPAQYGIWLTLSSIAAWMVFFDFGLGNGLRNKLAEALSQDNIKLAKSYVSTAYFLLTFIIIGFLAVFFLCNHIFNWTIILNAPSDIGKELNNLVIIIFSFFGVRFISVLIETILVADQKPALANFIEVIGGVLSLLLTYILVKTTQGSLIFLGIALGLSTAIIPALASLILFNTHYHSIMPSWKYFQNIHSRELLGLGMNFFVLQLCTLLIFSTPNIVIAQLFNPAAVVPYNIAFKYYSIATMFFTIILMPFWSAYTEAYARNDIEWIKKSMRKLLRIWVLLAIGVILMTVVANKFYSIWVGATIHVPLIVSLFMGLYVLETTWCAIFVNFINGIGKIRLQLRVSIVLGVSIIPLSIILGSNCQLNIAGVILAPCILLFPLCIVWPIQAKKILYKTATGVWNK